MTSFTKILGVLFLSVLPISAMAQVVPCTVTLDASLGGVPPVPPTYNMSNGTISTCSGMFYDPGNTGNYSSGTALITQTFCSDQPGEQIILDFSAFGFQVETNYDFLNIYDGSTTGGTNLWNSQTSGGATNPGVITSTTGCLTITFSSDGSVTYQGWQAEISCTNPSSSVFDCNGGTVLLTASGAGQQTTIMSNNFNGGNLGSGWVSTGGSSVGTPCGPSLDGTPYYWASTSTGTPNLTTVAYDVSCGGVLSFDMAYATQGGATPCEGPDLTNEGVTLQYSTDGGATWTVIDYWDPLGGYDPTMTAWNNYSYPIPPGAMGPNTQFQWVQNNSSGTCCDNWGIDNVTITANTNCAAYWYDYTTVPGTNNPPVYTTTITSTSTIGVWYTNGTDSCYASTTVIVPPGTTADAGPDQTICASGSVTIGGAPTTPDNGALYTWSTGATGTISGGNNGQISVSPVVTTEYYLEIEFNGCFAYDTVTVFVDAPPTASNPATINVQCSGLVPAPNPNVVTDEADDITIPPAVTFLGDVSDGLSCPETITRTYRVTDGCGNFIDVQQLIVINDTQAPVLAAAPANITVQCSGDVPAPANLGWTDNCDGSGTVLSSDGPLTGGACGGTITRTWTYTDACGNMATANQTITVNDTQAPVLAAAPANITVQCSGDVPAPANLGWTDNCDGSGTVLSSDGPLTGGTCGGTITRTWTYTDACGNMATANQTITVNDTQAPVLAAAPANITVQCSGDVPAPANLGWTDNCDGSGSVLSSDGPLTGGTCGGTITRTWTYTDACGNLATATQTITINDTQAPVFAAAPANITVQCSGDVPAPVNLGWTDNCDGSGTVLSSDGPLTGGTCGGTITRTWTYTDACGNVATTNQTITVHDTQVPVFAAAPAALNVQCSADVPAMTNLGWTDNCDGSGTVMGSDVSDGLSCPETITRTWTYTDACGNVATTNQTITVNDTQAPVFAAAPANVTVECIGDVPAATNLGWTDNCDGSGTVLGSDGPLTGGACGGTITRTWTYTDACGNVATTTQTITIDDTTPPTASNPAPQVGVPPAFDPLQVTDEADNCSVPTVTDGGDVSDGGTCPEIITRTYIVSDACGNSINVTQTFTIGDAILPTASNPAPMSFQCSADVPPADPLVVIDEADNGAVPTVTFESESSDGLSCPETITRTYRVTDDCGNFIFVTQTITVNDTQAPVLAAAPAALNVQCSADVPAMTNLGWTDNCDGSGTVMGSDVSDGLSCPETITRTWTYTDACGNVATTSQTITVHDTQAPVFAAAPANTSVQCSADVPVMNDLSWTDNCDGSGMAVGVEVSDGLSCPETITRTWTYTDACGNVATTSQTITVHDTQVPVFAAAPAALNVQCSADVPAMTNLGWTDNCDGSGTVMGSDVSDGLSCPETITRTWTYTDACGNVATTNQTITVNDTQAPVFAAAPANVTVECIGDVPAATNLSWTDNCDGSGTVLGSDGPLTGGACGGTITRTWTYTDACGNIATTTQTITVDDTTPPTASNPATTTVPGGPAPVVDPTVVIDEADNCTVNPTVTFVSESSDNGICPETITRIYEIADECGNTIQVTHTILITDPFPPTASNPAPMNFQCSADVPPADPAVVTDEADNTVIPTVTFESESSDGLSCPETITRTYRVTDDCGNFIFVTQTITVNDTQAPVLAAAPAALNVQCSADVPAMTNLGWTDNCDGSGTVMGSDVSDGLSCPETITRTWTYTDACGNVATTSQTITVHDTQAPVFAAAPANTSVQCSADVPVMNDLSWTDNCDGSGMAVGVEVSDGLSCPETITRTWTYTDACGNVATTSQTITVHDTQVPVFAAAPAALNVQCSADVPAMTNLGWTDNCDGSGTVMGSDVSDGLSCPETITRTWTYTDACGNVATTNQTITVNDTQAPVFAAAPANVTVECIGDVPAATNLGWTDNCDGSGTVLGSDGPLTGGACGGTITRTWTYTDACGNIATTTQTITVDDTTPPTASNPVTTTVPGGPAPVIDPTVVIDEADNCTVNPTVTFVSESSDNNPCPETITRIYEIEDECGNTTQVTHLIVITDPILPTASAPAPITVQCIGDVPPADVLVITDEADNQGVPTVAFVGDVSNGQTCPETITRTYSITDVCGNVITVDQIITVDDTTLPTASNPSQVTVQCSGDVPVPDVTVVTDEADNCTVNPVVAFVSDVSDGLSCPETITRTYSVTDDCNNQITVTQTIIVDDTTLPMGNAPATVNVECIGDVPAWDITSVTGVSDNCTVNPVVAFVSDVSDGLSCPETITRTYSVTDDCGNQITVSQQIIVNDVTLPTASNPLQVTVQCSGDVPLPDVAVVTDEADNCTVNPVVAFVSDVSDGLSCPETITRTYSVTDDCNNQITVTQTIIVDDTTLPTASNPLQVSVQCSGDVPLPDVTVVTDEADNCTVNPVVAFVSDVSDGLSCPETITRTYSVTDDCNNQITVTQTIIVDDTTLPTASNPSQVTVQCSGDVPVPDVTVVTDEADNCTVNPVVAFVSDVSDGLSCPETITRTYSVTDDCNNQITVTQTIIVDDTTLPMGNAPATVNVECIGDVPAWDITSVTGVSDNCTVNPVVAFVSDVSDGLSCPETITRTYSVTDDCGNQITVSQQIIVNDVTLPTASNPLPVSVPGANDVPAPDVTVVTDEADNCTVNPLVEWVSDVSDGNVCNGEIITRTYSITDDCGNQITVTQEITILAVPAPINAGPDQTICEGDLVTIQADNPWNVPTSWSPNVPNGPFDPVQTTTYTVTADNEGCLSTDEITITVEAPPAVSFMGDVLSGCEPLTVNFTNTSSAASGLVDCIWTMNGQTLSGCGTVTYTFPSGGLYDVTLTTTSATGCVSTATYDDYIYVEDTPIASFVPSQTELSTMFTEVDFENTSTGAVDYEWDFGDNTAISTVENPSHTFPFDGSGSYVVELMAYSELGCVDSAYMTINVEEELLYFVPNTFTPDGDDYNEYFQAVFTSGFDPYDFTMLLFNRWGEVIWESHDATVGWDGTYGTTGRAVQDGTYTWKIEFKTSVNDERKMISGHVNVIR